MIYFICIVAWALIGSAALSLSDFDDKRYLKWASADKSGFACFIAIVLWPVASTVMVWDKKRLL